MSANINDFTVPVPVADADSFKELDDSFHSMMQITIVHGPSDELNSENPL